jgi:hypothetical protein
MRGGAVRQFASDWLSHRGAEAYRTYIIAGVLLLIVIAEKGLGIDIPGAEVGDDWLFVILNALGLGTLRAGIGKALR